MSFIDGILEALGIEGGSLRHIQDMARSVQPAQIEAMAGVFEQGESVFDAGHTHLESAVDKVVTGWKGEAARAASTSVLDGAMTSRSSAEASATAASNVRSFAAALSEQKAKILAVPPVDTSLSHAISASGGPVLAALNPGAVAANMAAAQIKSDQHRDQAAGYLHQMDQDSDAFARQQQAVFPPGHPSPIDDNLPATITVHAPGSSGGGRAMPAVSAPSGGGSGGAHWAAPPTTGTGGPVTTVHQPHGGNGTNPGHSGPGTSTGGPVTQPTVPPGDPTTVQGAQPPGGGTPVGPPVALPEPTGSGSGIGSGTAALLGGGAAAIAAGGVAGWNRGGWPGGRGLAADGGPGLRGGSGAAGDGALGEGEGGRGFARGGFGAPADEAPGRFGAPGAGGLGGLDPAEESALRASRLSASAGELAAGERGLLPPMGGAGGRRSDEEELEKRPDYLVETDDVWGDGRLAAPPVLG